MDPVSYNTLPPHLQSLGAKVELEELGLAELALDTPKDLPAQGEEWMVEEVRTLVDKASICVCLIHQCYSKAASTLLL